MTRQFFVGGNFKMNPTTLKGAKDLASALASAELTSKTEVVIAPPAIYLFALSDLLKGTKVEVSAQNVYFKENGAFTGEISPAQLADAGIPWVIIGHSERRTLFGDTDALVAHKTKAAIDAGISVILCVGETLEERESGKTLEVVERQLAACTETLAEADWSKVVVAYEPVWAIGTGKVATADQAQEVHCDTRKFLTNKVSKAVADATRIIYGGSVNASNCKDLGSREDIDGFLVGGASLKPEFVNIINTPV